MSFGKIVSCRMVLLRRGRKVVLGRSEVVFGFVGGIFVDFFVRVERSVLVFLACKVVYFEEF